MIICRDAADTPTTSARTAHTFRESNSIPYVAILPDNERLPKPRLLLERVLLVLVQRPKPLQNKELAVERAGLVRPLDKLPPKVSRRLLSLLALLPRVGICPVTAISVRA